MDFQRPKAKEGSAQQTKRCTLQPPRPPKRWPYNVPSRPPASHTVVLAHAGALQLSHLAQHGALLDLELPGKVGHRHWTGDADLLAAQRQ